MQNMIFLAIVLLKKQKEKRKKNLSSAKKLYDPCVVYI
jgi:hypothetical protein